jgi:hypothetical protein
MKNQVIENIDNPENLERLYRNDPDLFIEEFSFAYKSQPDSPVLSVWNQRLNFQKTLTDKNKVFFTKEFHLMAVCSLMAGIATRIILHFTELNLIAPVNLIFGVAIFTIVYFLYHRPMQRSIRIFAVVTIVASIIFINLLTQPVTDGILLSYLHVPIVLWMIAGLSFSGDHWKKVNHRLSFLKVNGEFVILYAIMAISGLILAFITIQLFQFAGLDVSEFYMENIVLFGASSLSVVGFYLVSRNLSITKNIAPVIARLFSPLMVLTLSCFLITMVLIGKNPFVDRDFLLFFNIILIVVLAISIFSISERESNEMRNIFDYNVAILIVLAIIIDGIALSAILLRLSSYGISANRLAVLGINLIIFVHLIRILYVYIHFIQNNVNSYKIQRVITEYLPVYGVWAAIVTFTFPIFF